MEVHTPEDHECQCFPCQRFRNLDSQLEKAKQLVARLAFEKEATKSAINAAHDPITGRLPIELTTRIFALAMSGWNYLPSFMDSKRNTVRPPLLFGAICRRWREIAWLTPSLWTEVDICLSPGNAMHRGTLLDEWIRRSGQLPLLITIRTVHLCPEEDSITFSNEVLDVIN
ncbi:unnamed protein product [Cyclocybe aegerita]|uniref:F-box domain-containing protein n=1 Tax=Cyclocybe aegerita TaxID=1973307 RepID=A0A8S0W0T2_CYCAE|nr:unnamed protein product [Cyclocybe aegerita]